MGDDRDLAVRLARDLDGSFEALVDAYQDRLYAFAARMTGDHHDAEEIAQDAFVRAYRALAGYDRKKITGLELRPWLYTIAMNALRNRRRGRRHVLVSLDGHDVPATDDPAGAFEDSQRTAALVRSVAALPARHRAAVLLRYFEDLSYEEIAAVFGDPVGTVKSNVHRGVARLRAELGASRGGELDG